MVKSGRSCFKLDGRWISSWLSWSQQGPNGENWTVLSRLTSENLASITIHCPSRIKCQWNIIFPRNQWSKDFNRIGDNQIKLVFFDEFHNILIFGQEKFWSTNRCIMMYICKSWNRFNYYVRSKTVCLHRKHWDTSTITWSACRSVSSPNDPNRLWNIGRTNHGIFVSNKNSTKCLKNVSASWTLSPPPSGLKSSPQENI